MRDDPSPSAAGWPGGQAPPTAQPESAPEHPQSHTEGHQPHDEAEARRPPSRLALGGFLLALVLFGAALSWWGLVPGAPLYTGAP
ncbi:hypothetical protein [Deinococcus aluminii]|uniref:Uncharacterized protein n=1 Tax=Deinococcus aluminii TaxID=1656885 RepID=A0ABP9XFA5_9DEIO